MADRMLMITWAEPVRGAEVRALEVFNEALGILGRAQQEDRIDKFDVALFQPNGETNGYIAIQGTAEQIAALQETDDFRRNVVDSTLCVERICHREAVCNEGVAEQMGMYQAALERIPQRV